MPGGPEYLICRQSETPTYEFACVGGNLTSARSQMCGKGDPTVFTSPAQS